MRAVVQGLVKMRSGKFKRDDLLVKIKANREKHIAEYAEAVEGYKTEQIKKINAAVEELTKKISELQGGEPLQIASISFGLKTPQNHSKDYDQVILMLEMGIEDEIVVQSDEFARYVMDDWDWKEDFRYTNSLYKK